MRNDFFPRTKKSIATVTSLALLLAVPGPWSYQALAATFEKPAGINAPITPLNIAGVAGEKAASLSNPLLTIPSAIGTTESNSAAPAVDQALLAEIETIQKNYDQTAAQNLLLKIYGPRPLLHPIILDGGREEFSRRHDLLSQLSKAAEDVANGKQAAAAQNTTLAALDRVYAEIGAAPGTAARVLDKTYAADNAAATALAAVDAAQANAEACKTGGKCPFAFLGRAKNSKTADASLSRGGPTGPKIPYTLKANFIHRAALWLILKTGMQNEDGYWTLPKFFGRFVLLTIVKEERLKDDYSRRFLTDESKVDLIPFDEKFDTQPSPNGQHMVKEDPLQGGPNLARGSMFPLEVNKPKLRLDENGKPVDEESRKMLQRIYESGVILFTRLEFRAADFLSQPFGSWIQQRVEGWIGSIFTNKTPIRIAVPNPDGSKSMIEISVPQTAQAENKKEGVTESVHTMTQAPRWTSNELYGMSDEEQDEIRAKDLAHPGRVKVGEGPDGQLPPDPNYNGGIPHVPQPRNMWIGRALLDNLFLGKNHNYLADRLTRYYTGHWTFDEMGWNRFSQSMWYAFDRKAYLRERAMYDAMTPQEKDDFIFAKAWLVNAGVIIKIHTADWTPELLPNPVTFLGMHTEYSGVLGAKFKYMWFDKEWAHKALGWLLKKDVISGIGGSPVQEFSAPYELSETFVNAYRIRELARNLIRLYQLTTGRKIQDMEVGEAQGVKTMAAIVSTSMANQLYSHGLNFAGDSGQTNNVPNWMETLERLDGLGTIDMRFIDVLREMERGEPHYTLYRKLLRMSQPEDFLEMTGGNEAMARTLAALYRTVDDVPTHVGKRVYPRPWGSVLSGDQLAIFGKYAPWRQYAYHLFSSNFGPRVWTPMGIQEVLGSTLKSLYLRFYPELAAPLDGPRSAFNVMNRIHPEMAETDADGNVVKTMQQVHDEEVAMGVATHNLDRLAIFGPLARRTLFGNSTAGDRPKENVDGQVLVQPVGLLGKLMQGQIRKGWQGTFDTAKKQTLADLDPSEYDGKDAWSVTRTISPMSYFMRDELRQAGPNVFVGRTYFQVPFLGSRHIADFAVEYSAAPTTAKLMDSERTAAFAMGDAGKKYFWINAAVTLAAWAGFGALAWYAAIPLLIFPAVTATASWAFRRKATLGMAYTSRNAPTAEKTVENLIHRTFQAQDSARKAAKVDRLATLGMMGAGLAIVASMIAVHPIVAIFAMAVVVATGQSTIEAGKKFLESIDVLKTSIYGELSAKVVKRSADSMRGDSDIERHYGYLLAQGTDVATPKTTLQKLKALGFAANTAMQTTISSHGMFARKIKKSMTADAKDMAMPERAAAEKTIGSLGFLGIYVPRIIDAYNSHGTGVYAREDKVQADGTAIKRGDIDMDVFNRWFTGDRDYVTRADMDGFFQAGVARGRAAIRWWNVPRRLMFALGVKLGRIEFSRRMDQLFQAFPDRVVYKNGVPVKAVSQVQLLYFFQGGLQYDMERQRHANDPANAAALHAQIMKDLSDQYIEQGQDAIKILAERDAARAQTSRN